MLKPKKAVPFGPCEHPAVLLDDYDEVLMDRALGHADELLELATGGRPAAAPCPALMGFPTVPFRLCDFWAIQEETEQGGILIVRGELPGGTVAVAKFRRQDAPRGSWTSHSLKEA